MNTLPGVLGHVRTALSLYLEDKTVRIALIGREWTRSENGAQHYELALLAQKCILAALRKLHQ